MLVLELAPDIEERNYAKAPLTRAEVTRILDVVGSVEPLLNTRNKTVKEQGWRDKAPSKRAFVSAVVEDNNVLKRPVIVRGKRFVIGFDEEAVRDLLA